MPKQLSPKQALVELYKAVRMLNLKAEDHEVLAQLAQIIDKALPKEEETKEEPKKK